MRASLLFLLLAALLAAPLDAAERRHVHPGKAYGAAIFTGMFAGSLIGAAAGALPYATERKSQDPNSVIMGAVYGAVAGAVGLGTPCAAYEVGSDKEGSGTTILYNTFGFAVIGGAVGGMGGVISYRRKIGYDDQSAEDFLGAAAAGVLVGGILGLGVGFFEGVLWNPGGAMKVPGKGIHAKIGLVELAALHPSPEGLKSLPNLTFARLEF